MKELYHIRRVYEKKRRRIQKVAKAKPKIAKKIMQKYSKWKKNRAKDFDAQNNYYNIDIIPALNSR